VIGDVVRMPPRSLVERLERTSLTELMRREARALREGDTHEALDCRITRMTRLRDAQRGRLDDRGDGGVRL
jgi:hypothetical protein